MMPRSLRWLVYLVLAVVFALWRMWEMAGLAACMVLLDLHAGIRAEVPRLARASRVVSQTRLRGRAENVILSGVVFALFGPLTAWPPKSAYVIYGLVAGSAIGLVHARVFTGRGQKQLERHGRLEALPPLERWSTSWWLALSGLVLLFTVSLAPLSRSRELTQVIWTLYFGYCISWGGYTWAWARRKEREGFRALAVPVQRH
jgi:hypothetical protein